MSSSSVAEMMPRKAWCAGSDSITHAMHVSTHYDVFILVGIVCLSGRNDATHQGSVAETMPLAMHVPHTAAHVIRVHSFLKQQGDTKPVQLQAVSTDLHGRP